MRRRNFLVSLTAGVAGAVMLPGSAAAKAPRVWRKGDRVVVRGGTFDKARGVVITECGSVRMRRPRGVDGGLYWYEETDRTEDLGDVYNEAIWVKFDPKDLPAPIRIHFENYPVEPGVVLSPSQFGHLRYLIANSSDGKVRILGGTLERL